MNDDLNTPEAIAIMWNLIKDEKIAPGDKRATLLDFDRVLGIGFLPLLYRHETTEKVQVLSLSDLPSDVEVLLAEREKARKGGEWAKADELRDALRAKGFSVEDSKDGPVVRRAGE